MFFFLDIPKWVMVLMASAVVLVIGVGIWLLRSNLTVSGGAVEYMDGYEAGSGRSSSSANRIERTAAPESGFELKPGQRPSDTVIKKGNTNTASVPSQTSAPPAADAGRGRGGRN